MSDCTPNCTRPRPNTKLEHCRECHQTFASTAAGDSHRIGRFGVGGPDTRRCRSAAEMEAVGMWMTATGGREVWHGVATSTGVSRRRTVAGLLAAAPKWEAE